MRHIKRSDLLPFQTQLPPLAEQRRIAEILDTVDEAIRKTEEVIAKLQQMKQGLLHDLLTRGIDDNGELRDPDRHPEQFKGSPIGCLPADWNVRNLEKVVVAPICYGIVQAGLFVPGGPEVVMIRDLRGQFGGGLHRTSPAIESQYVRSRIRPGDVLVSIKGTIGRLAVVPEDFFGNISRDLARLRFGDEVNPSFAVAFFSSDNGQRSLELSVVGTTRAEVSIHALKRVLMPVPPIAEQLRITSAIAAAKNRILEEEGELNKLRDVKRGLMDDLLTGRVRVNVAAAEEDAA